MAKISVFGAGTWGLGISILLHNNGHSVTVWSAVPAEIEMLRKTKEHKNLPGVKMPEGLCFTDDLEEATREADLMVLSVASVYTRATARRMKPYIKEGQIIVNVAKGIEEGTLATLRDQIAEEIPQADVAVLSGPSHAEEVSRGIPTTCVAGATTQKTAETIQNIFMSPVFRVYTSPDVLGIELGGALKNVIALAAGIADGLGYGDNTKAALITRGMTEIVRLGIAMGAKVETLYGLSGIGDLIVTCASMHSRNRRAGILMGKGYTMEEAMKEVKMVVEGVYSAKAARALAEKYQVTMPIVEQVNQILFEGKPAAQAVEDLMLRDKRIEHPSLPWE
ncbi:NAD(P)H-dependent glycerol-3-phosphate dehydrogenase [Hominifimenecus sp. rT4P-3]|uniref:NAD(P)H-dependent glycerol-3-phosphate dehydrogenase n=1 Tax=Hominifimenecus sp. rT4P-3 TaxID=3242979 RepID=UPI003DA62C0B